MGIPLQWLAGSPFADFLLPGLFLLVVLGVAPLVVAYGLWAGRRWTWAGSLLVGVVLLAWLTVQITIIGFVRRPPLQVVYGGLALAILGLALSPSVRRRLLSGESAS